MGNTNAILESTSTQLPNSGGKSVANSLLLQRIERAKKKKDRDETSSVDDNEKNELYSTYDSSSSSSSGVNSASASMLLSVGTTQSFGSSKVSGSQSDVDDSFLRNSLVSSTSDDSNSNSGSSSANATQEEGSSVGSSVGLNDIEICK